MERQTIRAARRHGSARPAHERIRHVCAEQEARKARRESTVSRGRLALFGGSMSPAKLKRRKLAIRGRKDTLRNQMISLYGRSCWLCGRGIADGDVVSVDHVRPRHISPW